MKIDQIIELGILLGLFYLLVGIAVYLLLSRKQAKNRISSIKQNIYLRMIPGIILFWPVFIQNLGNK